MNNLSRRREAELFTQLRRSRDPQLREALVRRYLPLARHTARRFSRSSDSLDDLNQVAAYALLKAIDGFDPSRGLAFTSYAVPTISGELKRHARDTGWGMRVPRGLQERALDVEHAISALTGDLGRSPTPAEIGEYLEITSEEVLEAIDAGANHTLDSLDTPLGADGDAMTRLETLGVIDPGFDLVEDAQAVGPLLRELPERERTLLALRFHEELSQSEIARRLGISQMHVSRLLRRTLDELASQVEEPELPARCPLAA
ncbi:MAG TPA: SigB/SigF/SigG family RNA polymerase sigma factor [Thermoleophilaceae bacterium]|nr:SigB/SigF/SigG family RNA polymerase sigma factor [Thermoleophilaceae bacterium]